MTQVIGSSLFPISFVVVVVHLSLALAHLLRLSKTCSGLALSDSDPCDCFSVLRFCLTLSVRVEMAGHKVAHATLKGPSVVKELVIGLALGLAAGGLWKMHHWNEQRKTRAFYDLLERGEISVVHPEE
ncbi:hypothetical protein HID58_071690 [Brassica napus]|uniref:BnaC06g18510D protein n=8 Tax=Brassiceae TaxID=981071 RepID=A0A078GIL9_BRANA|nr:hypothetical protein HID58_071690 [Brassica napus]CAF2060056.1 unnamed protein product [Brassica napus]CDY25109.1 BnaC06g18510D [Brassica napus]VDD62542.1 unnamed protein product [Brassica oleracea]